MGTGLQEIPFRIPEKWDAHWYAQHLRDVLALADARNSIGVGLTVTGEPNTLATYSVNEDIRELINQPYILAEHTDLLPNERVLTGEPGVISIEDFGPDTVMLVGIEDHGIEFDKLVGLGNYGVIGRSPADPGGPEEILASQDGDVLCVQSDALGFTNAPIWTGPHRWVDGIAAEWGTDGDLSVVHSGSAGVITNTTGDLSIDTTQDLNLTAAVQMNFAAPTIADFLFNGETLPEIAQDAVGNIFVDSDTIDFTYNDGVPSITAEVIESYAYEWTANHTWADNAEVRLGTGGDGRIFHDGADTYIRNDTGALKILDGATQLAEFDDQLYVGVTRAEVAGVTGALVSGVTEYIQAAAEIANIGAAPALNMLRFNGSYGAPTAVANGNTLFQFNAYGYYTSGGPGVLQSGSLDYLALDNFTSTTAGTRMRVRLAAVGTVSLTESLSLATTFLRLPNDNQELQIGAGQDLRLFHDGTNSSVRNNTGDLLFLEGAGEVARVTTANQFLIGTSSALTGSIAGTTVTPKLQLADNAVTAAMMFARFQNSNAGPFFQFLKSRSGTIGTYTVVQDGDNLGRVSFAGADGTDAAEAGRIQVEVNGTPGDNDMPGRMMFLVTADGSQNPVERMRITNTAVHLLRDDIELQLGVGSDLRLYHNGTNSFIRNDTGVLNIDQGATTVGRFDSDTTAGNTRFMIYDVDNGTLERVSVGAADSGGTGFKVLRIPN